jgi:hypothetical protein
MPCGDCDAIQIAIIRQEICDIQTIMDECCGRLSTTMAADYTARLNALQAQLLLCLTGGVIPPPDVEEVNFCHTITIAGPYGAVGDRIREIRWFDTTTNPPTQTSQVFINENTGATVLGVDVTNSIPCAVEDDEYLTENEHFCAVADSPPNYPNPGDPIGTAYQIGDRITASYVVLATNILTPVVISYKNLSNGTYPLPFYLQNNGVDIIGSFPNPTDFGDCAAVVNPPQTPVIDGATFLSGSEITGAITTHIFNVPLKGVSVWNGGGDFIIAEFTTVPATTGGNRQMIIPPGGTAQVQIAVSTPELITQVELSTLNGGVCPAIVNAVHPGGV